MMVTGGFIELLMMAEVDLYLNIPSNITLLIRKKILMVIGDVDICLRSAILPPIIQLRFLVLSFFGDERVVDRSYTIHLHSHNHGGQYRSQPRFPQDDFPRGYDKK